MSNIWEFFLQTGTVSLVALLLLFVKRIFADKLSPRWQYGIWFLLALRILLPVQVSRSVLLPLPLLVETVKTNAELYRGPSAYTAPYLPLSLDHVFPWTNEMPVSLTDWVFWVYIVGVVVSFLWVLVQYWVFLSRLHGAVDRRASVVTENIESLANLRTQYRLPTCPIHVVPGLSSPFVCGFFRPMLVLPDAVVDETVLLHELLHLRYRDVWQNLFWCALRSLHWCNPFLWYLCRRIGNDMESLCDTRVLERLDGEDRRHYGTVLLSMVQEKYARAPGTSSLSNGGKNIARRIDAIVRFKKYPAGMGTVSICMALVLSVPLLWGSAPTLDKTITTPPTTAAIGCALAYSRLHRCGTIAGALDTYAKGLISSNGVLIALSTSLDNQQTLAETMTDGHHLPTQTDLLEYRSGEGYRIFNLKESETEGYEAILVFPVMDWYDMPASEDTVGLPSSASLLVPVRVWKEGSGWIVEETGERIRSYCDFNQTAFGDSPVPPMRKLTATGQSGTVTVEERVWYQIDNAVSHNGLSFFNSMSFSNDAKPDVPFKQAVCNIHMSYDYHDNQLGYLPTELVGAENMPWDGVTIPALPLEEVKQASDIPYPGRESPEEWRSYSGSSSSGAGWTYDMVEENEAHRLYWGSGDYYYDVVEPIALSNGYGIMTFWDEKPMELFLLSENDTCVLPAEGGANP